MWLYQICPIIENCLYSHPRTSYHNEQVSVRSGENRNVHRDTDSVRLVETNAEVSLSAQQQEDEHGDVHEAHTSCRRTRT